MAERIWIGRCHGQAGGRHPAFVATRGGRFAIMSEPKQKSTIDLSKGVAAGALDEGGMLLGHVGDKDVVLVRAGNELFAVGANCTHYRGPLAEGLVVGDTIRCPWHHACFNLRTGEATRPPALNALAVWEVTRDQDRISVQRKGETPQPAASHRSAPTTEKF